jgi:hypothetical protein
MTSYASILAQKIRYWHLNEKKPSQTVSGVDWNQVLLMIEAGMSSEGIARSLLQVIEQDIEHLKDFPDATHRHPDAEQLYVKGRPHVRLGHVIGEPNLEFGPRFDSAAFLLLAGLTGFGKTTAVRQLLEGIPAYNQAHPDRKVLVLVFDRKGGDFADQPRRFGWKHYDVHTTLRLPLEAPPGLPAAIRINIVASIFCARAGLKASWTTFVKVFRWLLAVLNPTPGKRLLWPDFGLLLAVLNAVRDSTFSSKPEYTRSLKQPLEAIVHSTMNTFKAFRGFRAHDLVASGQSAVISMPNMLPSWMRQLFVDLVLASILYPRIHTCHRIDRVEIFVVIDEADADVSQLAESMAPDQMCTISEWWKRGREFGLGGCVVLSSLEGASPLVLQNSTLHLMFHANDWKSSVAASKTLMLGPDGPATLNQLETGECMVKMSSGWHHTMKGVIDYVPPCRTQVKEYDTHPYVPAQSLAQLPHVRRALSKLRGEDETTDKRTRDQVASEVARLAKELLQAWVDHPYTPVVRLFEAIGPVTRKQRSAVEQFIRDRKYADFEETRFGRSASLLMEPTGHAYALLGLPIPQGNRGRGGITHRHMAHWIKDFFARQGREAALEWTVPGTNHPVDVAVRSKDGWKVFEVSVTATDNLDVHIQACFVQATDPVVNMTVVTTTKVQLAKVKAVVESQALTLPYAARIRYEVIDNYIPREVPK